MTVCVGLYDEDSNVLLGTDSAAVSGWQVQERIGSKLFTITVGTYPMAVALAGSYFFGQILRYGLHELAGAPLGDDVARFMQTTFADAVLSAVDEKLGSTVASERWKGVKDGSALIAFRGKLFEVWAGDGQLGVVDDYSAHGSGQSEALGALAATEGSGLSARARLDRALAAAEKHNIGVRRPFTVLYWGKLGPMKASDAPVIAQASAPE